MPPKNPKAATPAEVGPQEIHRVGDKKGIAKIRLEVRKQREKAVLTKILQEVAQDTAVAEICRQLGKRKREKAVFTKYQQEMERGDITDEKINRAWNELSTRSSPPGSLLRAGALPVGTSRVHGTRG